MWKAKVPPPEAVDVDGTTVLCADTKLVSVCWVGDRSLDTALSLFADLRTRVSHRVQIIADVHASYLEAVPHGVRQREVDFADAGEAVRGPRSRRDMLRGAAQLDDAAVHAAVQRLLPGAGEPPSDVAL